MKKKKLNKKTCVLYIIIITLVVMVVGCIIYMNCRINELSDRLEINNKVSIYTSTKLNEVIKLNKLNTNECKYIFNSDHWEELLSSNSGGFKIVIPDNWQLDTVEIYNCKFNQSDEPLYEFTITLNVGGTITFNEFTKELYNQIKSLDYNDIVQSFNKDKGGYYEIASFEEATYNNMYYDYITVNNNGEEEGPRTKIKVLYLENENQVKIEVNKY